MNDIERRVASIEQLIAESEKLRTMTRSDQMVQDSRYWALHSMVKELAMRAGLSEDLFLHHFDLRKNHYHDRFLRGAESVAPGRAAELDERTLDDIPTEDGFPPMLS